MAKPSNTTIRLHRHTICLYCRAVDEMFVLPGRTPVEVEPSSYDKIRDSAMKVFAAQGVAATSLRMVAEEAGVSTGLVQHYFHTKAGLVNAIDDHVLRIMRETVEATPLPHPPADPLIEMGRRVAELFHKQAGLLDYVARTLVDGDEIGSVIFDGLVAISTTQWHQLSERGLAQSDLDPVWAVLHPVLLRFGPIILRPHIERHLGESFTSTTQLKRWDTAVTALLRDGQMQ